MLAKTETEDESGERRKIELKLAAVENEKKEMGNIISQLQNQVISWFMINRKITT